MTDTLRAVSRFEVLETGRRIDRIELFTELEDWKIDFVNAMIAFHFLDGTLCFLQYDDRVQALRALPEIPAWLDFAFIDDCWVPDPDRHLGRYMAMDMPYKSLHRTLHGQAITGLEVLEDPNRGNVVLELRVTVGPVVIHVDSTPEKDTRVRFFPS